MGESAAVRSPGGPAVRRRQDIAKTDRDHGGPEAGPDGALEQEVGRLHRLGVEAMSGGLPADAARHHRAALRLLEWPLHGPQSAADRPQIAQLAGSLLISLAHAEAEQGRTALGLSLLGRAELLVRETDRGRLHGQRGLLLLRTGNSAAALESLDSAVALLAAHDDRRELARALLNRATCAFEVGRVGSARADLERCGDLARDLGWPLMEAKALHNFGYCQFLRGDIPAALGIMARAAARYAQCDPGILPILMVDKARALLAAGLADDARTELDGAIALFRDQRLSQDQAEAELLQAQAALPA
jgi:tetratricopeptide (TPR) repeat protein